VEGDGENAASEQCGGEQAHGVIMPFSSREMPFERRYD